MSNKPDVLIIGAGIIGCCLAYEMSKAGFRTLNVDFQQVAGAGSTGNSCGNVRFYYSTRDGCALAYESAWYWQNWKEYIGVTDPRGMARFHQTGTVFIKNRVLDWDKIKANFDQVGVPYEEWDLEMLQRRVPAADFHSCLDDRELHDQPGLPPREHESTYASVVEKGRGIPCFVGGADVAQEEFL